MGKAGCAGCHPNAGEKALLTDYPYDNIGVPPNPANPNYAINPGFIDLGIGGFRGEPAEWGKEKVPTLRNLELTPDQEDAVVPYLKTLSDGYSTSGAIAPR